MILKIAYECAGVVGIDPSNFTLRELDIMCDNRLRTEWMRTAHVLCMMANINRDEKKQKTPFTPSEFMPFDNKPSSVPNNQVQHSANTKVLSIKDFARLFGAKV